MAAEVASVVVAAVQEKMPRLAAAVVVTAQYSFGLGNKQ
jgi:hypothetical protein